MSEKKKTLNSCSCLHQILTDFHSSFAVTLSVKFAVKRSLQIPPYAKRVATLPCEILVFTRDSICYIYSAYICYGNSVRLSVCLSVTRAHCIQTAEHIIEILSLSDRPIILVFRDQGFLRKSDGFTPNGGAEYKGVAIFDQYVAISRKR